ncbi:hypothetical protein SELMODRAFT_125731 [Selaginella moellendorffii]|uniref:Pentacotripeptide-repeat region of PRORP domain-containing protein n=1 Tax=Selaginella moellendorffii TaxID=88036 RepID=D8SVA1_SELML|nr:hypothetical protein SELMODRAFT_125731 [Selaginella moellendorffii]
MPNPNAVTWTAMLVAYGNAGHLEEARNAFEMVRDGNTVTWNAMISAYARHGHLDEAKILFATLPESDKNPNDLSFMSLLNACSHGGLSEQGLSYFGRLKASSSVERSSLSPSREHYCCMVDMLGRSGRLRDAEELVESMPFEPGVVEWGSLLGACKTYSDVDRASRAVENIVELDPGNRAANSALTLLSNVYAAAGRIREAEAVQTRLRSRTRVRSDGNS